MMTPLRYHGYPQPDLITSEVMRKIAYDEFLYAHMQDTFEPLLIDVTSKKCYAVPDEVDDLKTLIYYENIKLGTERAGRK